MVVTAWPSARKAGIRQLCTGSPSSSTVQAPQSPASQPFLTPKWPSSRRNVRRHCPARGCLRNVLPLISKLMPHPAVRRGFPRPGAASCACARPACRGRRRDRGRRECDAGSPRAIRPASGILERTAGPAAWSRRSPSARRRRRCRWLPINSAAERPTGVSEIWRNADRRFSAASGMSICRSRSPGCEHVALVAGDEVGDRNLSLAAVGLPDRADAVERRRQRDHRPGRQRHADVAADGCGLPDLEGGEEGAAALVDQRRGEPVRRAGERVELRRRVQVAAIDRPVSPIVSAGHFKSARSISRLRCGLRFREQPGAAREPSIACRPNGQLGARFAAGQPRCMVFRVHG